MGGLRFAREVRSSLGAASDCARELNHEYVGTEHLLLGLLKTVPGLFPGADAVDALEDRVHGKVGPASRRRPVRGKGTVPYTSLAKRALARALEAAADDGAGVVEPKHLLKSLIDDKGHAGAILRDTGFQWDWAAAGREDDASWDAAIELLSVDDEADVPYYAQIVARVKECVAAGELRPGDRLPPVRRLADRLELAPGTVARAYALLEEDGVVDTHGPKGTTVAFPKDSRAAPSRDRVAELTGLLRPVVVAAFHLGGTAEDLFNALQIAIEGVFDDPMDELHSA
jgi:DNA-binding transcriptional regulator YhcF (GntR family)